MFGLLDRDLENIYLAIKQFDEIEKVIIFGSRAMGNYKKGSDIDIALVGEAVTSQIVLRLDDALNQVYPIPYFFDIIQYEKICNERLKEHIDSEGQAIYTKSKK